MPGHEAFGDVGTVFALSSGAEKRKHFATQLGAHHDVETRAEDASEALQKL